MVTLEITIDVRTSIFVEDPIRSDKVKVEPTETGFLLSTIVEFLGEILPRFQNAPITPHFKMTLSEGYRAAAWARDVSSALSFLTDAPTFSVLKSVDPVSPPDLSGPGPFIVGGGMAHAELTAEPPKVPLTEDLLKDALEIVRRLSLDQSLHLVLRSIGWYARGVADVDLVYKFMDHWISLETLSNVYDGKVNPTTCPHCKKTLNTKPGRALLREFLRSLGYAESVNDIMKCGDIRSKLFHAADAEDEARFMQPILTITLKNCIFKTLQNLRNQSRRTE